jgi:hypothetical protein
VGEVIRLLDARSPRLGMPAGHINETDAMAILSVTKYWENALTQIGTCHIGLPDSSKERLNIDLASLAKSCARPEIGIGRTQNKTHFT